MVQTHCSLTMLYKTHPPTVQTHTVKKTKTKNQTIPRIYQVLCR